MVSGSLVRVILFTGAMPFSPSPIHLTAAVASAAALTAGVVVGVAEASATAAEHSRSTQVVKRSELKPAGIGGRWKLTFDDEFNGRSLSRRSWTLRNDWTQQNNVTDKAANVSVSDGTVNLTLSSDSVGAEIATRRARLRVGDFAEARVELPGSGREMKDWDAFWAAGPTWWQGGENDVAESLRGQLTVNYHSPTGTYNKGFVRGRWGGTFHTYGIYRGQNFVEVYYAGHRVKRYTTDDDGQPETFIFTVGVGAHDPTVTGTAGTMRIDFLRVWKRLS